MAEGSPKRTGGRWAVHLSGPTGLPAGVAPAAPQSLELPVQRAPQLAVAGVGVARVRLRPGRGRGRRARARRPATRPTGSGRCGSRGSAGPGACAARRRGRCRPGRAPRAGPGRRVRSRRIAREGQDRAAVDRGVRGRAGRVEQRRREVGVRDQLVGDGAGRDAGAADQQRHVRGGVVGEVLALDDAVLALEEAVVGGEQDVGRVEPPRARERARRPPRPPRRRRAATRGASGSRRARAWRSPAFVRCRRRM